MRKSLLILLLLPIAGAIADSPLPPASRTIFESPSGKIEAISDPKTGIQIRDTSTKKVLWRIPEWHRQVFVADDGVHAVTIYNGLNLLPVDYDPQTVLFTFWRDGTRVGDVTVARLVRTPESLQRTESHFYWGDPIGIAGRSFRVRTADGAIQVYDLSTGTLNAEQGAAANP